MAESFVGDARTHATLTLELRLRVSITISPQRFSSVFNLCVPHNLAQAS